MSLTLQQYCDKYNYELIKKYTTLGNEKGSHFRAVVRDKATGERYHLYYDPSRRRRSPAQQKKDYETYMSGGIPLISKERGWRNTTLSNRRKKEYYTRKALEQVREINDGTEE